MIVYVEVTHPSVVAKMATGTPFEPSDVDAAGCLLTFDLPQSRVQGLLEALGPFDDFRYKTGNEERVE